MKFQSGHQQETPCTVGCLLFITAILQYCNSQLRTGQVVSSQSEVDQYEVEVRSVDHPTVVEVRRPCPGQPELGLQNAEVEDIDYIVGIGIASLLYAKL